MNRELALHFALRADDGVQVGILGGDIVVGRASVRSAPRVAQRREEAVPPGALVFTPARGVDVSLPRYSPRVEGRFAGWKGDFQGFFLGLRADNTRAYFEAHRREYEEAVKGPMVALLADLEPEFGPARLARPNRDIRFSADKSPYKTSIYASTLGGGYVALDAAGLVAAGGRYLMDADQLARFRSAVVADRSGNELARIVDVLLEKAYELGDPELKRVPPPHQKEHPRADLLRHKRLIYWRRWEIGRWIATSEARERVVQAWRDGSELNDWFATHVDT